MKASQHSETAILKVCDQLEQALFAMPSRDQQTIEIRLRIEEAIEVAYEIAYARHTPPTPVLPIPFRALRRTPFDSEH